VSGRISSPTPWRLSSLFTVLALLVGLVAVAGRIPARADGPLHEATEQAASDLAEQTGQAVQVLGDTTADTIVYAQPDGTFRAELSSGPVREPDPTDPTGWTPVDLSLEQGPNGVAPAVADADYTLSSGGAAPLATLDVDSATYAIDWPGSLPAPAIAGTVATYPDVQSNMDVQIQAETQGYGMSILVPTPPATPRCSTSPCPSGASPPRSTTRTSWS
jgi:hypothetical protein